MEHINFRKILPGVLFSVLVTVLLGRYTYAQSITLSVSPPTFELSANPGRQITNSIKVTNGSDETLNITTDKRNFTAIGEEGAVGLTEEETTFSLASWITLSPEAAMIEPGETKIFSYQISVPSNAEPGGYFGSIVFASGGAKANVTGAAVAQEVASLILLRVAGDVTEKAKIDSFSTDKSFYEYGPVEFELRVENEGNVHVKPSGKIVITNLFGKQVAELDIEPRNVLPGAVRKLNAQWDKKYLFGNYSATASVTYIHKGEILTSTATFSGLPYKYVAFSILGFSLIGFGLYRSRKRLTMALKVLFGKANV